jgi:hypothetical protein
MKLGSEQHKQLFCRSFIESHLHYEPENLPWPELDSIALERLRGIPFWREALATEREAGVMVSAFAETVQDPVIREAIALQGVEEHRHGRLLEFLIHHYDIPIVEPSPVVLPEKLDTAFLDFGYGECLDSFFAFGMFGIAQQARYMPDSLFTIFDPILHEEARHIVFFINWITYEQIKQGRGAAIRGLSALWHYGRSIRNLVQAFGGGGDEDQESQPFTASEAAHFMDDLTPELFLSVALRENTQRMSVFDPQLLQPRLSERLSGVALRVLTLLPGRKPTAAKIQTTAAES